MKKTKRANFQESKNKKLTLLICLYFFSIFQLKRYKLPFKIIAQV